MHAELGLGLPYSHIGLTRSSYSADQIVLFTNATINSQEDFDAFIQQILVLELNAIRDLEGMLSQYHNDQMRRNSLGYGDDKSSRKSSGTLPSQEGVQNICTFRRHMLCDAHVQVHSCEVREEALDALLMSRLFDNNSASFETFVTAQVKNLDSLRGFCYCYWDFLKQRKAFSNGNGDETMDEEKMFQPLFASFLRQLVAKLPANANEGIAVNEVNNVRLTSEVELIVKGVRKNTLSGYTDVAIADPGGIISDVDHFRSIIELKPPFGGLWHSAGYQQKDQLLGEMMAWKKMANERQTFVGALTDLFLISIMFHSRHRQTRTKKAQLTESADYYLCPSVSQSSTVVKWLMLLCLDVFGDDLDMLFTKGDLIPTEVPKDAEAKGAAADKGKYSRNSGKENKSTSMMKTSRSGGSAASKGKNSKAHSSTVDLKSLLDCLYMDKYNERRDAFFEEIFHRNMRGRPLSDLTESAVNSLQMVGAAQRMESLLC